MLRITEVKKSTVPLGSPIGKEASVKLFGNDFNGADIYLKYGRELLKLKPVGQNMGLQWNKTLFDTALNHPRQPWDVSKTGDKPVIFIVNQEKMISVDGNSQQNSDVDMGDLMLDDYKSENSTILLVNNLGKEVVVSMDDLSMLTSFVVGEKGNKFTLQQIPTTETQGLLRSVAGQDQTAQFVTVNSKKSFLYRLDGGNKKWQKISLTASSNAAMILKLKSNEVIHISPQGLSVYSITGQSTQFKFYCPLFSAIHGWSQMFTDTLRLMMIKGDQEAVIGTGPKGIEYFPVSSECKSYVVDESKGNDKEKMNAKHALVAAVSAESNNKFDVLGYYNGGMYVIKLQVEEAKQPSVKDSSVTPQPAKRFKATASQKVQILEGELGSKPTRWLRDTIDESSFKNIVDKLMGKVQFTIPLIDMQDRTGLPIKMVAYYEETDNEEMSVLGRYWTLGKDCIVLDHGNTVFEDKQEFYLVKDQMKIKLERDWSAGTGKAVFNMQGNKNVTFDYNGSEEKWEVGNGKLKYIYGIKGKGAVTVPAWSDWKGPSGEFDRSKEHVVQWNLIEIKSEFSDKIKIKYEYGKLDPKTNMMHLKRITDDDKTTIQFKYQDMQGVGQKQDSRDVKEHKFINNKFLESIEVDTSTYKQSLKITSKKVDNLYYLESINQDGDSDPVLRFDYNTDDQLKPRLSRIQLPSKSYLDFEYRNQPFPTNGFQQEVAKLSDLYSGSSYSLMITKESGETRLKVEQKDSSGWNYSLPKVTVYVESYGGKKIQNYQPFMHQNYFAVVVNYADGNSKIYIFNKDQTGVWKPEQSVLRQDVFNDKLFKYDFQEDYFVYYASGKLSLFSKKSENSEWSQLYHQISDPDMIVLLNRGAVYFKNDLMLLHWDQSNKPIQINLSAKGKKPNLKDLDTFFTRIDLQGSDPDNKEESQKEIDDYKKELTEQFNSNGLVMYNNLVAVRTAELSKLGTTSMKVFLYLLNKDYGVSSQSIIEVPGENLKTFNLTLDVFDEGKTTDPTNLDKYRFEFKEESDKYKLKFISATDKDGKETKPSKRNQDSIAMYERKMRIPLDFEKYMMQVNHDGIILGNQQIYHKNGVFTTKPMDRESLKLTKFNIPLGEYTSFRKDSEADEVKVCYQTQSSSCGTLSTNSARNVSVKYPYYLVAQRRNDVVVLPLKINSRGWEKQVVYPSEVLHGSTSHSVLVTTRMSDNATIIRPLKSLNNDNSVKVRLVVQEKLTTPHEEHLIKYEYGEPVLSAAEVLFRKTVVIPGGHKELTGYYEETTDLTTNEQTVRVMTSQNEVFDPEYVKRMHEMEDEQKKQQDQPQIDEDGTLFDATRSRPLLKTKPYAKSDRLIHYIGFEDYEDMGGWQFSDRNIRRNAFPATGRNYLKLQGGDQLIKNIQSVSYYEYFVASAWVRVLQEVTLGSPTNIIEIEISGKKIQGEIKENNGEWLYIEAITNTVAVPKMNDPRKVNLKVTLKPPGGSEIHVDHVRISPLSYDFEASVYDSQTGRTTALIHNNGQISYRSYDANNRRVAEVSEQGQIKFLASYTKRSQMRSPSGAPQEGSSNAKIQIRPKRGWMESFSPYSVEERWDLGSSSKAQPGVLQMQGTATYKHKFSADSVGVRMFYSIQSGQLQIRVAKTTVTLGVGSITYNGKSERIPTNGEVIVLTTPKLVTIWVEGHIVYETVQNVGEFKKESLSLQASGSVEIRNLIIMENVEIQVSYMNRDFKPLQEILLQDAGTILVRQLTYDSIGRKVAETVWAKLAIGIDSSSKVLQYHEEFIRNDRQQNNFLISGSIEGSVNNGNDMYQKYPYSQTEYYDNPLEIRSKSGHPGVKYSIKGEFKHEYKIESDLPFIKRYYPKEKGYRQEQEKKSNGRTQVVVYNRRNKKVAEYIQVSDYNNILTTYAFNEKCNQVQMLPPSYYEENKTNQGYNPVLTEIESPWASTTKYDSSGEYVVMKSTPDGGRVDFLYNDFKQLTYQMHFDERNKVDKIVYFLYNAAGKVCEAGKLKATSEVESAVRKNAKAYQQIPNREYAMYFDYGENDPNPAVRDRMQRIVKRNNEVHFDEALFYDEDGNLISKSYISPVKNESLSLEYLQENDKIGGIRYPFLVDGEQLVLKFDHNLRGEVTKVSRVRETGEEAAIVDLDHDAQGKVTRIGFKYGGYSFDQNYVYKAPGYLSMIQNEFLNETMYYTSKGYGTEPTGDGSILRTEFQAGWHNRCDQNLIPVTARTFESNRMSLDVAEMCFDALNKLGYFDELGRPLKTYYPDLEVNMPAICSTGFNRLHLSSMLFKKGFPEHYGHAYDYGTHGELIAAKSFVGQEKDKLEPSLKEKYVVDDLSKTISELSREKLSALWKQLVDSKLIDKVEGIKAFYTDSNKSSLSMSLINKISHILYTNGLVGSSNPQCENLLKGDSGRNKQICENLLKTARDPPMHSKLRAVLAQNSNIKSKLINRLWKILASVIGNSPGDVESYSIDPNGNHKVFYTGFNRYELSYKPRKNQIASIKQENVNQEIQHDSEGNVVKALHKNIEKIEYDPLTQRVSRIEMTNKHRVIEIGFDYRGERTLKRVRNQANQIISETYYVRDNKGNTLVEYKLEYPNPDQKTKPITTVTAYVHGPLGLLGFFRNNKFYNTLLDHEGSTRLVLLNGEVVAAYDYFPYGQLMRIYGSNPEAHIAYRYTGQEYDEETGLYNYHARLYDPDIGRFFQMDPMEQYASPYKYAGNSPVSQIDPDGQIAITLIVMAIGALVGAYIGASSANNSWNPAKWAWDDKKTWIGIFAGAAMGAMAVYGGAATFSYFAGMFGSSLAAALATGAISVAGAFLGAAAAANEWNPAKWDWSSPAVWNGLLNGISIALSFPSGFVGIKRTFFSFAFRTSKIIYGVAMSSGFLLLTYVGAAMANNFNFRLDTWDWKSPRTWFGMVEGVSTLFLGTASAVKHGAAKTHFIVQPNKVKLCWYRINIPAKSFTVKQIGNEFVLTWYKYGNRMGIQIVKSEASLMKHLRPVYGATEAFFISHAQRAKSVLAMGMFGGFHVHNFQTYFAHEPSNTTETASEKLATRRKRFIWTNATSATSSSASFAGWLNGFIHTVTNYFNFEEPTLENRQTKSIQHYAMPTITNIPGKSFEKLCYSPANDNTRLICPQREAFVNVFSKLPAFEENSFGRDTFSNCMPLSWQQHPSVVCDGQETTFIYTPQQDLRVFELVDGWLLLARIAPAAIKNLMAGFRHLKNCVFSKESNSVQINDQEYQNRELELDLKNLKNLIQSLGATSNIRWAEPIFEDLELDIEEFSRKKHPKKSELSLLQERMDALQEELEEEMTPIRIDPCIFQQVGLSQLGRLPVSLGEPMQSIGRSKYF
ncbi:AAEL009992-PA [Aedes aegypti]|uniref:AAEL009992-PA n=1 Tax=Aedes aegypti TaxID=7159 RepID=Q16U81_AEDAE|nr:AAEL009992-PA [Aedes aegypti]